MPKTNFNAPSKSIGAKTLLGTTSQPARPKGKVGQLVERLETTEGATLEELTELNGWQPHTVRAALTRLRQRRFKICLEARSGRKAHRLDVGEG